MRDTAKYRGKVVVRPMTEDDIDQVVDIDNKITVPERAITYAEPVDSYIGGELAVSCVAEVGGEVVGFVLGRIAELRTGAPARALLELIGIDPRWQRHGIGTRLMEGFIQQCKQRGCRLIHVLAYAQDEQLRAFVISIGFSSSGLLDYRREL